MESTKNYYLGWNVCEGLYKVDESDNSEDTDLDFAEEYNEDGEENSNGDVYVDADREWIELEDNDYDKNLDWTGVLANETQNSTQESLIQQVFNVIARLKDFENEDADCEELDTRIKIARKKLREGN